MSWKQNFRGNHTETALKLFQALKRRYPGCYFVTEETIMTGVGGFVVDFLFKEVNLVVEVDGEAVHDGSDIQRSKTVKKRWALERLGYTVLNVPNQDVIRDRDAVADLVGVTYLEIEAKQNHKCLVDLGLLK